MFDEIFYYKFRSDFSWWKWMNFGTKIQIWFCYKYERTYFLWKCKFGFFFNEKYISGFCMKHAEWVFNKIQIRFSFENTDLVLYEKYRLDSYEKYRSGFLK